MAKIRPARPGPTRGCPEIEPDCAVPDRAGKGWMDGLPPGGPETGAGVAATGLEASAGGGSDIASAEDPPPGAAVAEPAAEGAMAAAAVPDGAPPGLGWGGPEPVGAADPVPVADGIEAEGAAEGPLSPADWVVGAV